MPALKDQTTVTVDAYTDRTEGADHINIALDAHSRLGSMLATYANMPFEHPELGTFSSIFGYFLYVKSGGALPELRNITHKNYRQLQDVVDRVGDIDRFYSNFWDMLGHAMYCQLQQNEELRKEAIENQLPIVMYYYKSVGKNSVRYRMTPPYARNWLAQLKQAIELVRHDVPFALDVNYEALKETML